MFFSYLALFLLINLNIALNLVLNNKKVYNNAVIDIKGQFSDLADCRLCRGQSGKNAFLYINRPNISTNCVYYRSIHRYTQYKPENCRKNDNLNRLFGNDSDQPAANECVSEDSAKLTNIGTNDPDDVSNGDKSEFDAKNGIDELIRSALSWKFDFASLHDPTTEREIAELRARFLESEDSEADRPAPPALGAPRPSNGPPESPRRSLRRLVDQFSVELGVAGCPGCGVPLQHRDPSRPGFVAREHLDRLAGSNQAKCLRCCSLLSGTFFQSASSTSATTNGSQSNDSHLNMSSDQYNDANEADLSAEYGHEEHVPTMDQPDAMPGYTPSATLPNQQQLHTQSEVSDSLSSEMTLEMTNRIKLASVETVSTVRNMLRIKRNRRLTIVYIIDAVDPHIETGLLDLIKQRQDEALSAISSDKNGKQESINTARSRHSSKRRNRPFRPDGGVKFYLAVNKIDLLPKHKRDELVLYFRDMVNSKVDIGLRTKNIFPISCKRNIEVDSLLSVILSEAKKLGNQVLFIGPTNSGKSTLINKLRSIVDAPHSSKSGKSAKLAQIAQLDIADVVAASEAVVSEFPKETTENGQTEADSNFKQPSPSVTSSIVPGTTLGVLPIKLGMGLKVYDTPGIFIPDSLVSYLSNDQLKEVIMNKACKNTSIRMKRGRTLLIDKYARLDVTGGRDFFVKCYLSDKLKVYIRKTHRIPKLIEKEFANSRLYYPKDTMDLYECGVSTRTNLSSNGVEEILNKDSERDRYDRFMDSDGNILNRVELLDQTDDAGTGYDDYADTHYTAENTRKEAHTHTDSVIDTQNINSSSINSSNMDYNRTNTCNNSCLVAYDEDLGVNEEHVRDSLGGALSRSHRPSLASRRALRDGTLRRFDVVLSGWDCATCDLCVKGLGFLSLGGALRITFDLFTRPDVSVSLRRPLFPKNIFPFRPRKS